jgi:guanylate kinase
MGRSFKDRYYGTLKLNWRGIWNGNKIAVFDVDVKGGINLKKKFVNPPCLYSLHLLRSAY